MQEANMHIYIYIKVWLQQSGKSYLENSRIIYLNRYYNKYMWYIVRM